MAEKERAIARIAALRYWRKEDARVVTEAWRQSGLSLVAFAERHDLHPRRVGRWAARLQSMQPERVRFHRVELVARGPQAAGVESIEVVLGDGCTVRVPPGFAPDELRQVLDVLSGRV
jgi:hypothetical protein